MAIEQISGKNIIMKRKNLIKELHGCLKELYSGQIIPNLHSSLVEILGTALDRFVQMGLIDSNAYGNKKGSTTSFLQSNSSQKVKINDTLNFLLSLRPMTAEHAAKIDEEVTNAVLGAQGPQNMARL
jgi:hypothetical protein